MTSHVLRFTFYAYNGGMTLHIDDQLPDAAWDAFVERRADGHALQTSAWLHSNSAWVGAQAAWPSWMETSRGGRVGSLSQAPLGLGTSPMPQRPLVDWDMCRMSLRYSKAWTRSVALTMPLPKT